MKILQLCNKPPFPAVDGGCIAMKNISLGLLKDNVDLKIITISTEKHPFQKSSFPQDFIKKTKIQSVFIDTRINIIDAFSALVTSDSYNVSRFFSADFDKTLKLELEKNEYDVIHLESLFLTPYIGTIQKYSKAKVVLRSHNLEHLIWERLANLEGNVAKKVYLKHLSKKLKKYEKRVLNDVCGIAAISYEDTNRYSKLDCQIPLTTIPFGIDINKYQPSTSKVEKGKLRLFHIGSMDWSPNVEAINWFFDSVYPLIDSHLVDVHLAGKNMPNYIEELASESVFIHGMVPDALSFMADYDVMIVPLLSGSGMRIKIIEAMAMGKTVITTSVGLEGIDAVDGDNVFVANTSEEFKTKIDYLVDNPEEIKIVGDKAREFIEKNHDNSVIINRLMKFYKQL